MNTFEQGIIIGHVTDMIDAGEQLNPIIAYLNRQLDTYPSDASFLGATLDMASEAIVERTLRVKRKLDYVNVLSTRTVVYLAYVHGLLQYNPLVVSGVTVTMRIRSRYNELTLSTPTLTRVVNVYNDDSEYATESVLEAILLELTCTL